MGLRDEKKQLTRREILAAAEALFRERGYTGTRVVDIIGRVRISEKTFFNYFPSKASLLQEMKLAWFRGEAGRARAAHDGLSASDGVIGHFLADVRAQVRAIEKDREFMALVFSGPPEGRGRSAALKAEHDANFAVLRGVFGGAQERGEIRRDLDPQEIAEHYVSLLNSTVARWLRGYWAEPDSLEERVMRALDLLVHGLRPRAKERP